MKCNSLKSLERVYEMAKKKEQQMSTDVAKAVWEEYANLYRERWLKQLIEAQVEKDWNKVQLLIYTIGNFRFDFNRSNK